MNELLLHTQAFVTLYMVGLIWFVQVVHYPLFARVGTAEFSGYEVAHSRLTTLVVVGPMLVELAAAAALLWRRPEAIPFGAAALGFGLVVVIWLSTFLLQVPQHSLLESGFDAAAHARLVVTNWIRTVAWSVRGGLVLWMLDRA